jgi:hypothetical protein
MIDDLEDENGYLDIREESYCNICGRECESMAIDNGMCPMCFELNCGIDPIDVPHWPQ